MKQEAMSARHVEIHSKFNSNRVSDIKPERNKNKFAFLKYQSLSFGEESRSDKFNGDKGILYEFIQVVQVR